MTQRPPRGQKERRNHAFGTHERICAKLQVRDNTNKVFIKRMTETHQFSQTDQTNWESNCCSQEILLHKRTLLDSQDRPIHVNAAGFNVLNIDHRVTGKKGTRKRQMACSKTRRKMKVT